MYYPNPYPEIIGELLARRFFTEFVKTSFITCTNDF